MGKELIATDGLVDIMNRVNTGHNIQNQSHFIKEYKPYFEMAALLQDHWVFQKAATIEPFHMTRKFRNITSSPDKFKEKFEELGIEEIFCDGARLARVYGGAIGVMVIDDGLLPSEPLQIEKIRKDGLLKIELYEKPLLSISNEDDVENISATQYTHYTINTDQPLTVHKSRVLEFKGDKTLSTYGSNLTEFLGNSIIYKLYNTLVAEESIADIFANLPVRLNQMVLKIPDLLGKIQNDQQVSSLTKRITALYNSLTMFKVLIADSKETVDTVNLDSANVTELDRRISEKASTIVDIPELLFLGKNPTGLSSNGESGLTIFYDKVEALQKTEFNPNLRKLDPVVSKAFFNSTEPVLYEWIPLYHKTNKAQVEVEQIYINNSSSIGIQFGDQVALEYLKEKGVFSEDLYNFTKQHMGMDI